MEEIREYAASVNPGYTEDDVPRLIKEVRHEEAEAKARLAAGDLARVEMSQAS